VGRIKVPVRLLWGREDAFLEPELARFSLSMCEQGELTYFDQATHWLHQEEPKAVNKLLLEFIKQGAWSRRSNPSCTDEALKRP
jgi:pimeloyl-ACP methyl ester carboxylesterase